MKSKRCPRCGEPARSVVLTAQVRVDLYYSEEANISKGIACKLVKRVKGTPVSYSCGGGHVW